MGFTARWIKLGRLFMVASLVFYVLPISVIFAGGFSNSAKAIALSILLGTAAIWAWFWTRIAGGPDARFRLPALVAGTILMAAFTLMTPPQYGSLFIYVVLLLGGGFPWRFSLPGIAVVAALGGGLDLMRGASTLSAVGEVINDVIVGMAAAGGRLVIEANRELAIAREQIGRLAVDEERLRFARDLHDLLGHSLSVIAIKSELAGRLLSSSPEKAATEIADIESVSRNALKEVREAVAGYSNPTLPAVLAGAKEALTAAGIDCRVQRHERALPSSVEAVLAWTVREGATNVIRHSQAKRCSIRVVSQDGNASVEIVDDGQGGTAEPGSGLLGLKERVAQLGGRLEAGPLPHEGFRLRVNVPVT